MLLEADEGNRRFVEAFVIADTSPKVNSRHAR
jgi:hypothetical protein